MKRISAVSFFILLAALGCAALNVNTVSLQYISAGKYDGRALKLVRVLDDNKAYTKYYITYMSGSIPISGIMNIPKGKGPFPVIITAHGFIEPRYYTNGRGLKREQDYLARRGYIVLHPDYRNHAGSGKDPDNNLRLNLGYTEDVINAVYAIKDSGLKSIDKDNIGLLGHSLGGGIGLNMMVAKPGLIKAYVLFAPISMDYRDNYYKWIANRAVDTQRKYGSPLMREKIEKLYGSPDANPSFWDNLSAQSFLRNITEPVMVHQGVNDPDVSVEWTKKLEKALNARNKNATFYYYNNEKHEFINAWPQVMNRTTAFFNRYLKPSGR